MDNCEMRENDLLVISTAYACVIVKSQIFVRPSAHNAGGPLYPERCFVFTSVFFDVCWGADYEYASFKMTDIYRRMCIQGVPVEFSLFKNLFIFDCKRKCFRQKSCYRRRRNCKGDQVLKNLIFSSRYINCKSRQDVLPKRFSELSFANDQVTF